MNKERPTLLIVAVVLGIALGVLGVLGGCFGVFGAVMQGSLMDLQEQLAQSDPSLQGSLATQRAVAEAQAAFRVPTMILAVLNMLASAAIVVGAGLLAGLKRSGATVYLGAAVFGAIIDVCSAGFGAFVTYRTQAAMSAAVGQIAQVPGQDPAWMDAALQAGTIVGLLFALFWLVVKFAIYGVGIWAARDADQKNLLS